MAQPWELNYSPVEIPQQGQQPVQQPVQQQIPAQAPQQAALTAQPEAINAGHFAQQGFSGFNEGLANILGAPGDIISAGLNLGIGGINRFAGTDISPVAPSPVGSESITGFLTGAGTIAPESNVRGAGLTRRIGQELGATVIPGSAVVRAARLPFRTASTLGFSATGSGLGGELAENLFPDNPLASVVGELFGGGVTLGTIGANTRRRLGRQAEADVPSNVDLETQASQKYDEAAAIGVSARNEDVKDFASGVDDLLREEGVLLEAGDLAQNFPKVSSVRKQLKNVSKGGDLSVPRMQTLRRTIKRASRSVDGDEGRLGSIILNDFDDFVAPLAPPLSEARSLFRRAKKSEDLDIIKEVAETSADASGGDIQKSLRAGFRTLSNAIAKGQRSASGFRPDEAAAIQRVARGTRGGNIARAVGSIKPGTVGTVTTAGVAPAVAAVGRRISRTSTIRNAELADILIRNGVPIQRGAILTPELAKLGASLLAGQVVNDFGDER